MDLPRLGFLSRLSRHFSQISSENDSEDDNDNEADSKNDEDNADEAFSPTVADVLEVKSLMQRAGGLPAELADVIVDVAEYWPHSTAYVKAFPSIHNQRRNIYGPLHNTPPGDLYVGSNGPLAVRFVLRSAPVGAEGWPGWEDSTGDATKSPYFTHEAVSKAPLRRAMTPDELQQLLSRHGRGDSPGAPDDTCAKKKGDGPLPFVSTLQHPCRKIVFTIASHDQGWASGDPRIHHTYEGAYSWFDVGLERLEAEQEAEQEEEEKEKEKEKEREEEGEVRVARNATDAPDKANGKENETADDSLPVPLAALRTVLPPIESSPDSATDSRLNHADLPNSQTLQKNLVAHRPVTKHRIVWSWTDGDDRDAGGDSTAAKEKQDEALYKLGRGNATGDGRFVRDLRVGDIITVWAKARFGGWSNVVESAKIEVYWAT